MRTIKIALLNLVGLLPTLTQADDWLAIPGISPTTTLENNHLCYSDGRDIACSDRNFTVTVGGDVGIGTMSPNTALDVSGTLRISDGGEAAATAGAGAIKYDSGNLYFSDGSTWEALSNASSTVTELDDLTDAKYIGLSVYVGAGAGAAVTVTTNLYNTALGANALNNNTTGYSNTALSSSALSSNTTGNNNTATGDVALNTNTTGSNNTASGSVALNNNSTGNNNTALGYSALANNLTGDFNTASGMYAMRRNTTGVNNTASGVSALYANISGNNNAALGYAAGHLIADGSTENTTSSNSLYLGYNTKALADGGDNEIVIGYNATGLGDNSVVLGNNSIATTALKGDVGIGTSTPSSRLHIQGNNWSNSTAVIENSSGTTGAELQIKNANGSLYLTTSSDGSAVIKTETDSDLRFQTNSTERMRILNSGNVGIGTITPGGMLHINSIGDAALSSTNHALTLGADNSANIAIDDNEILARNNGSGANLYLQNENNASGGDTILNQYYGYVGIGTNTPSSRLHIQGNNWSNSTAVIENSSGTTGAELQIKNANGSLYLTTSSDGSAVIKTETDSDLRFQTNSTERIRILNSGNVGIGTSSPSVELDVIGDIEYTGTITDVSDRRLKTDIEALPSSLEAMAALNPVAFKMKDNLTLTEYGFIAQEVEEIYPNLVTTADDVSQTKSLNYVGLIAPMTKALQELKTENDTLKAQLLSLSARLDALEAQ